MDSWDGYQERCEHGVRWENRCFSCAEKEAEAARQRVAARLAAAQLDREWYGSMPSDKPGIERAIAVRREQERRPGERLRKALMSTPEGAAAIQDARRELASTAKPSISGLLVTAGEKWK